MVLRANTVAQSFTVDWLSNAPCVSISNTTTWRRYRQRYRSVIVKIVDEKMIVNMPSYIFLVKNEETK